MDRITLAHIVAHGCHGNNPGERDRPQPFNIDLSFDLDLSDAAASDALDDTIDYSNVYERVVTIVEQQSYRLLERLASDIIDVLFDDARVKRAEVKIAKPQLLDGATPSITLMRER